MNSGEDAFIYIHRIEIKFNCNNGSFSTFYKLFEVN